MSSRVVKTGSAILGMVMLLVVAALLCLDGGSHQVPLDQGAIRRLETILGIRIPPTGSRIRVYVNQWRDGALDVYVRLDCSAEGMKDLQNNSWIGGTPVSAAGRTTDFDVTELVPPWFDAMPHQPRDVIYESGGTDQQERIRALVRQSVSQGTVYVVTLMRRDLPSDLVSALTRYRYAKPPIYGPDDARYTREWP